MISGRSLVLASVAVAALIGPVSMGLIVPAVAEATVSVAVDSAAQRLVITDLDGANDVIVVSEPPSSDARFAHGTFEIESTQPLTRGADCSGKLSPEGKNGATCTGDIRGFLVTLGGGSDDWTDLHGTRLADAFAIATPISVNGGPGNDVLRGTSDDDSLDGGDGDDLLATGRGFDSLAGGAGADTLSDDDLPTTQTRDNFRGGPGNDILTIRGGDDVANGEAGADTVFEEDARQIGDTIDGGLDFDKWVVERSTPVTLQDGLTSANVFRDPPFGSGAELEETVSNVESFEGTNGPDVMNAALNPAKTQRRYGGRGGADVLVGSDAANVISGGNGRDVLHGRDGNDSLDAKAGEAVAVPDQLIDCGPGTGDGARIDLLDPDPTGCEGVERSAIREGPHVRIGSVRRVEEGTYAVRLSCPRKLKHRCRGTLELALTERGLERAEETRYSIRAGRRGTVRVRVSPGDARRLGRLPTRRAVVRSLEKGDVAGDKTTLARRRLPPA
jgi:hypothetical protein